MSVSDRIREAGIVIPELTPAAGPFRPYSLYNNMLVVSGQLPMRNGKPAFVGEVPLVVPVAQAQEAAQLCVTNILGWVNHATGGDFEQVERVIRLGGFVATSKDFVDAPGIINVASELINHIFGSNGEHARVAYGVASLPFGAPVEIEATFALNPGIR